MGESIRKKSLSGIKWSAIESYANQGIQFLLGLIMARLLLPSDYGLIGMVAIFFAVAQTFVDSGFGEALIRKLDRSEADFSTVFYFNIFVSIVCYIVLFFLAPLIASFFNEPILKDLVRVVGLTVIINSFKVVQTARFTIDVNFKAIAKATLTSNIISGLIGIGLAYYGIGVWALVFQNLISCVINVLILWYVSKWHPKRIFSRSSFKDLFSYGSKILGAGLLHTLYINITTLCIGRFYTPADLGYYTRGCQFPQLLGQNFTSVVQRVTFPILSELQNDDERLISIYRKYIRLMSMAIMFGLILLVALGKPLVLFLLGIKWSQAIIFLQIYAFAMITDHVAQINLNLLKVKGRSDLLLMLEVVKKTISFIILFAALPFGVIAICFSKVIYSQIATAINTHYTGRLFGLTYWEQLKDFGPYFVYSLVACLPAFLISSFLHIPNFLILLIGFIISTSAYLMLLRIRKDSCYVEFVVPIIQKVIKRHVNK